ncbi:MAG: ABC transporter permease [Bacteroidota bacterium]
MVRNYLLAALRSLAKDKLYSGINIIGLAVGLAAFFLIVGWVDNETSYDRHFANAGRTYRVTTHWSDAEDAFATTYPMIRHRVVDEFPEAEKSTRLFDLGFLGGKSRITFGDKVFTDNDVAYCDNNFFEVFQFPFVQGDALTAFDRPDKVVITRSTAKKFFGDDNTSDIIGKTLFLENTKPMVVSGVIEDIPANTHFDFDIFLSMDSHPWVKGAEESLWSGISFHTYVRLKEGSSPQALEEKMKSLLADFPNDPQHYGRNLNLQLQPVTDIHLHSQLGRELQSNGDIRYVYLFVTIAVAVLLIACFNYVNLTTSRHTQRFKEVGVRKMLGAQRKQLITQFMIESVLTAVMSMVLAVLLIEIVKPLMFSMAGRAFTTLRVFDPKMIVMIVSIGLTTGIISGIFPSLALSGFQPAKLFKPGIKSFAMGNSLRKTLIVFQFAASILLTICTAVTYQQLRFMQNAKLGYDKEQVVVLHIGYDDVLKSYESLKTRLLQHSSIVNASAVSQLPLNVMTQENIDVPSGESHGVNYISVDQDFFATMGIRILSGAGRLENLKPVDSVNHFVLNQSAADMIGWTPEESLEKKIVIRHGNQKPGAVVGVVEDFHFQSLHNTIGPLVIEFDPRNYEYLLVKVLSDDVAESVKLIESEWKQVAGTIPFDYDFLDQEYDKLYRSEQQTANLFIAFSLTASFIALLGLFGLSSFSIARRIKEIGVRRILGATTFSVVKLVSTDIAWMLLIAFVIATAGGVYFMATWLTTFAYKTQPGIGVFALAGGINIVLALATILFHAVKTTRANPVEALKSE